MKNGAMVRNIDNLGRVLIPKETRREMNIKPQDPMEILVDDDKVVVRKYQDRHACQVTGEISDQNFHLADGNIVLSPEGAKKLIEEIERQM